MVHYVKTMFRSSCSHWLCRGLCFIRVIYIYLRTGVPHDFQIRSRLCCFFSGTETASLLERPNSPRYLKVFCCETFRLCVIFLKILSCLPLNCLFFDLRLLITPFGMFNLFLPRINHILDKR
jgi:hypothetical protein